MADNNIVTNTKKCKSCDSEISNLAKVCHFCKTPQGFKNKLYNFLLSYTIPIILSIISIFQLSLSKLNYEESKQKRIDADIIYNKADNVLKESLQKAENLEKDVNSKMSSSSEKINNILNDLDNLKDSFAKEIDIVKTRNGIMSISDDAIANMNKKSYDTIKTMYDNEHANNELKTMLLSEVVRIKNSFINSTRIANFKLNFIDNVDEKDIVSHILTTLLLNDKNWQVRARSAMILASRKDIKVAYSLYNCIENENNLEVLRNCIKSFSSLTDYKPNDVFDNELIIEWWAKNEESVANKLKINN